mmetsp:Transcript_125721/g.355536  ORF Transcript_125721/g.355536 Transcript_125721/m.355536 type:complete len:349 (-) Transcript_125721:75-1121(-)
MRRSLGPLAALACAARPAAGDSWRWMLEPREGNNLCTVTPGTEGFWVDTWAHLHGPRPAEYTYLLPAAIIAVAALSMLVAQHARDLVSTSAPERSSKARWRMLLISVVAPAPLVFAALKLVVIAVPLSWKLVLFLTSFYEVAAFNCFFWLVISFLGDSLSAAAESLGDTKGDLPLRMWGAPPLGCILYPCLKPRTPTRGDLMTVNVLLLQCTVLLPSIALVEASGILPPGVAPSLKYLETCSLVTAMYGLFALLFATHDALERRCHAKFWVIKGTCVANKMSYRFFSEAVKDDIRVGSLCYSSEMLAAARAAALTSLLVIPFAVISMYAFARDDIRDDTIGSKEKRSA